MIKIGLDVDGVLNSLVWPRSDLGPPWREYTIDANIGELSVALRDDWSELLLQMEDEAAGSIFWNTMWQDEAVSILTPLLNVPEWEWAPVQQRFSDYDMGLIKARTAYRFVTDNYPDVPFAVVDDEPGVRDALDEMMFYSEVPYLFVEVDPLEGLSRTNMDEIICFGRLYSGRE